MTDITSPHDRVFKANLSDVRAARAFFKDNLAPEVLQAIDLTVLELCPQTYIDSELKLSQSDILYKTRIDDRPGYLFILLEHQSVPDRLMPLRMLKYQVGIWEDYLKQAKAEHSTNDSAVKLPLVVSLVFYNGKRPYTYSCDIKDLLDAPAKLIDQVWNQPFKLIDLNKIPDDELRKNIWWGVTAYFMKHISARDFLPHLREIMAELGQLERQYSKTQAKTLLHYALTAGETSDIEQFVETVKSGISKETGDTVMTIAEQLMERGKKSGIEQGIEKGKQQGKSQMLLTLLSHKFSTISNNYQDKIKHASAEELLIWFKNAITASSLNEVFREPFEKKSH